MKNIERRTDRPILLCFLGAQGLLPLTSIALFRHHYDFPVRTISYHLLLIFFGYLAGVGAAAFIASAHAIRARVAARYVLPAAWGSFTVALYFLNLLAWGGRLGMGMNLTPALVGPYILHPSLLASSFSMPPWLVWSVLALVPAALLLAYAAAARPFAAVLLRLGARMRHDRRNPSPPARQYATLFAVLALLGAGGCALLRWPPQRAVDHLFGDPIFASLFNTNTLLPVGKLDASTNVARNSYHPPDQFQRKNVILIVIDACRADHLGVMGYARDTTPFLDSLQRTGHLRTVRSFYSASCCTFGGVLSLLRSQHWFKMTIHAFALQDVLKKAGYRVHFVLGGDMRNFFNMKLYYGNSVDSFSDGYDPARHFPLNDDRGFFESFDKIAPYDGTPSFFLLHLMSVHTLSPRLPENVRYTPAAVKWDMKWDTPNYTNNYDNGVIQCDKNLRELFDRLQQKGYLRNSLVVITGDHGDSLGERNIYGHGQNLYSEEVTPPLLIYDPDPVTYRNLDLARQIDVAPTILDRLGLPIPPSWDGHSLLRDEPQRFSYLRIADQYAVIDHTPDHTLKYIYDDHRKTEELYDVAHDPHDLQNIFPSADAGEIQTLRAAIGAFAVHPGP